MIKEELQKYKTHENISTNENKETTSESASNQTSLKAISSTLDTIDEIQQKDLPHSSTNTKRRSQTKIPLPTASFTRERLQQKEKTKRLKEN